MSGKQLLLIPKNSFKNVCYKVKQIRFKHEWVVPQGYDTGIKIYNRATKNKVPLVFLNKNLVKWYICGPTVYDSSHIGHASCYIRCDIIRRILQEYYNIQPVVALGITDIDDKIIQRSNSLKIDSKVLSKKYELEFFQSLNELNILPPSFILRVSDHIPEIIEFVSKIIQHGNGYQTENGNVYFNTQAFKHYGKLAKVPEVGSDHLKDGKKCFLDFALWKVAKPEEPFWESPWGQGRPGWHIECSAMASKVFGSQLDLHSGGIDLLFPHHENEEAQSCCYHNRDQWVNYWIHTGELMIHEEKMSKSLNNFISISDFLETFTPDNLRMFCFISHYRKGLHYGTDSMKLASALCSKITEFLVDSNSYIRGDWSKGNICESSLLEALEKTDKDVMEHLSDDFNTGQIFLSLMELVKTTTRMLNEERNVSESRSPDVVAAVFTYVSEIFKNLGFQFNVAGSSKETKDQRTLEFILDTAVNFRRQVREEALSSTEKHARKNLLEACDSFRDELATAGIIIKDQRKTGVWSFGDVKKGKEKAQARPVR